jgi:hypothetical protein
MYGSEALTFYGAKQIKEFNISTVTQVWKCEFVIALSKDEYRNLCFHD